MSETIEAKELQLVSIFDDSYRFEIPEYQRPYAWTTEQTGELLDDLLCAVGQGEYVGDAPPYFLGSIVIIKDGRQPQAQIVDGQQRIISLTILFCVLRELASAESDRSDAHSYIYAPGRESAEISGYYRLTVRERDREFLQHNIQQMGGLSDLLARPHADLSDTIPTCTHTLKASRPKSSHDSTASSIAPTPDRPSAILRRSTSSTLLRAARRMIAACTARLRQQERHSRPTSTT